MKELNERNNHEYREIKWQKIWRIHFEFVYEERVRKIMAVLGTIADRSLCGAWPLNWCIVGRKK